MLPLVFTDVYGGILKKCVHLSNWNYFRDYEIYLLHAVYFSSDSGGEELLALKGRDLNKAMSGGFRHSPIRVS